MQNMLVEKNWINMIGAISLAIIPFLMMNSHFSSSNFGADKKITVQVAEHSID